MRIDWRLGRVRFRARIRTRRDRSGRGRSRLGNALDRSLEDQIPDTHRITLVQFDPIVDGRVVDPGPRSEIQRLNLQMPGLDRDLAMFLSHIRPGQPHPARRPRADHQPALSLGQGNSEVRLSGFL